MNILDVGRLLDVERYRRVDIDAAGPESLYADRESLAPARNTGFLQQCIARFREVHFAEQSTGRLYLRVVDGQAVWADRIALARALTDPDTRAGLAASAPAALDPAAVPASEAPLHLAEAAGGQRIGTLGEWGWQSASREDGTTAQRQVPA
jgi:hypothetical protein